MIDNDMIKKFSFPSITSNKTLGDFEKEINFLNKNVSLLKKYDLNENSNKSYINKDLVNKRKNSNKINKPNFKSPQYSLFRKSKTINQIILNNKIIHFNKTNKKLNLLSSRKKTNIGSVKITYYLQGYISQSDTNIFNEKRKKNKNISHIMKKRKLPPIIFEKPNNMKYNFNNNKNFMLLKNKISLTDNYNNNLYNLPLSESNKKIKLNRLNSSNDLFYSNEILPIINENKITDDKIKENKDIFSDLDTNSNRRKSIDSIIGKENNKSSCNSSSHIDKNTKTNISKLLITKIIELKNNNIKLNKIINNCKCKFEKMNFNLGTQLKYSKWKYQISDYDKYFIDMEHFGERESKEIERRKTFYDILEDAVDAVSEKKIEKKHSPPSGIETKMIEEQKKIINKLKNKNLHDSDIAVLKLKMNRLYLDKINARLLNEKEKRKKIRNILSLSYRDANDALKI